MAIFASTTLGSSDPSRAMSIKALEARAQALAQQQAQQQVPQSVPSPWQGIGNLANTAADAFTARRADQAAAARRQDLANIMGGIGPEGPTPQQQAQITSADPELGKMYAQQAFTARQNAADIAARREMAAEKARQDQEYATKQEERLQGRPQTDVARIRADEKAGRISKEEADAAVRQSTAPPAAQQKDAKAEEDANVELQSTISGLKQAQDLLNKNLVYSGGGAGFQEFMGKNLPTVGGYVAGTSPEKTKATQTYNQIVTPQVLDFLAKLKGASSDRDMNLAIDILNDRSADIETKKGALERLLPKLGAHLELSQRRLKELGREPVKVDVPPPAGGAAAGTTGATAAPTAGGGVQSVASEAEAMALPPGTRFKLPDGRTGTVRP